jgi:transcriptional antiterminator Rof (Rho-off)
MSKLTLDDISDLRAYERERDEFRRDVIQLKKQRRVQVGEILTLLFENSRTIRFQIQEMARIEKIISDEGIEAELRVYNPLIPEPGQLCATLFIELTSDEALRDWLPKLVGVERSVGLRLPDGEVVRAVVDEEHERQLTREAITASVHYVRWDLTADQIERFAAGPVAVVCTHPAYRAETVLADATLAELAADLRNGG